MKWKNKGVNESGGNRKESPGKEVEDVRACDEKREALHVYRKEGDGNAREGETGRPKRGL